VKHYLTFLLETHKISDAIQEHGVPMAMHMANSPVSAFASVHVAAPTENLLVLENHSVDVPTWDDIVDGVEKPIINKGFITVPAGPGLGFKLNEEALKNALREPGYFEPTPQWDNKERINDRLWRLSRLAPLGRRSLSRAFATDRPRLSIPNRLARLGENAAHILGGEPGVLSTKSRPTVWPLTTGSGWHSSNPV